MMIQQLSSNHNKQPQINFSSMSPTRRSWNLSLSSLSLLMFTLSSSSLSIKEKYHHRSLRSSFLDDQLAVIASRPLANDNIHIAAIHQNPHNIHHHVTSSSSQYEPNNHTTTIRYINDSLCSGCRYVYTLNEVNKTTATCWYEIENLLSLDDNNNNLSMEEAAIVVSNLYPNNCQRCNPNSCTNDEKRYYRPDDIITNQHIQYAKTHYLKSIDINDRVPINILTSNDELHKFLSDPYNLYPHHEYFMEFNPSITHLPKSQIPQQLLLLQGEHNDDNNYYVASYRVSTGHKCFTGPQVGAMINNEKRLLTSNDYLGVAILDVQLNILLETVVDIRGVIIPSIPSMNIEYLFQDGRLYTFNNQLYIGSFTVLYPIWLVPPDNNDINDNTTTEPDDIIQLPYYMKAKQKVNTKYNENNNNNLLNIYIKKSGYCSNDILYQVYGKNYNYFYDIYQQRIVLETYPMGPKEYIDTHCQLTYQNVNFIIPNKTIPLYDSYSTSDEILLSKKHQMKLPYSNDRGSYCCISITDELQQYYYPTYTNHTSLLIGISHTQTKKQTEPFPLNGYIYFHNLYAMEPIAPYNIVARSGRFCLGYPKYDDINNNTNNEIHFDTPRRREKPFTIGDDTEIYDCALIHFVSGMTEALHDPNQIIISYGVDDCYSRFIMISKKHILSLLFKNNRI